MSEWRPLYVRENPSLEAEYAALDTEVSESLRWSLWGWIRSVVATGSGTYYHVSERLLRKLERALKFTINWNGLNSLDGYALLERWAHQEPRRMLYIADYLLTQTEGRQRASILNTLLIEAGSAYYVVSGDAGYRLESRVDQMTAQAFNAASTPADQASAELREAWEKAYGMAPDASDAWDHAIKAVEVVMIPVVVPNKAKATLGDVAGQLKAHPAGYQFELAGSPVLGGVETVEAMLRLMWPNPDRHGGTGTRTPSLAEAAAVVQLAVTLVHWVRSGSFRKA